jgi:tetratricopeptide (TPR) repeat protein
LDEAQADLDKALRLAPQFVNGLWARAMIFHERKNNAKALIDLNLALSILRTELDCLRWRALIHIRRDEYVEALSSAETQRPSGQSPRPSMRL